jgi:hypothetical protein
MYPYSVYGYDAEADADTAVQNYLDGKDPQDQIGISKVYKEKFMGWYLPKQEKARL